MTTSNLTNISHKRNKVCTALGSRLRELRIAADMSQESLAIDAEVDRTYISQFERGVANPSLITLANLCYALDIDLSELFAPIKLSMKPKKDARRINSAKPKSRAKKT